MILVCSISLGDIRLVGGDDARGTVEFVVNGEWTRICHHSWDMSIGNVTCRQLGFHRAITTSIKKDLSYKGKAVLVSCDGHQKLTECDSQEESECDQKYGAVVCRKGKYLITDQGTGSDQGS